MPPKLTRIFIAEDSPTTRAGLKTILQRASDMEIVGEAEDGLEAVEQISKLKPDIVLMDIGLPGLSGLEATRKLKEKLPNLRVIMVTSNESDGVIFDAFSCGADGYFLKSNTDQLFQAVRSVVSGAAWLHPAIAGRVLRACVHGAARLQDKKTNETGEPLNLSKHEPVCRLLSLAQKLEQNGEVENADAAFDGAVALSEHLNGNKDPEIASIVSLQADMLYTHEKYTKAEKLYLKALELRHESLGYEHDEVAKSLDNLANLYDTRSNYAEAEYYYFWSLKIREKLSGPDHPLAGDTCAKLAWVYRAQGKTELAEQMEERAKKKAQ